MKINITSMCALRYLFLLVLAVMIPAISHAQLQVDCTGTTPGTFPSINAALPSTGAGTAIFVLAGPCDESLQLAGATDLFIGTYYGYPSVVLNGSINVSDSHGVYFHGLNITSATGDGINVTQSQALIIDSCTSSGNAANGLDLGNASEVLVIAPASFDGNPPTGSISMETHTLNSTRGIARRLISATTAAQVFGHLRRVSPRMDLRT